MLFLMASMLRRRRIQKRGATLTEVIIVVAMIGILATLAVVGYRKWLRGARTVEAKEIIQGVHMGQAAYHAETRGYLSCSTSYADAELYPSAPDERKHTFHNPSHSDFACWRLLNINADSPTYMSFATVAGNTGDAVLATPIRDAPEPVFPASPVAPWYTVLAVGDTDGDGNRAMYFSSSFDPRNVYSEREEE